MRIAVIPARGGSKRIPRKNIKLFHGKPMIAWSIEAALNSACFDRVIVSTDDEEIAAISVQYGADAPFMRPKNLSDDFTGTIPVINHAITWLRESGIDVDNVCCIYATAPFILPEDLQRGLQALKETNVSYAFAVTSYAFPIQRALRMTDGGRVEMLNPENFSVRSQDLEEAWHDAGQFYWGKASAWLSEEPLFSEVSVPILLPRHRVQDIDTPEDWVRAEWLFDAWRSS